jgi:single-strand DNA-binding protein
MGREPVPPAGQEGDWTVNKVLLTGRLTRDPEMRSLASGKSVTTFSVATNEYAGNGKERAEFHNIVTWDRLAETCGRYLGKGQQVAIEGRLQTRTWDDDQGKRHWRTEIVANHLEMLSGRRKKDYQAERAADALEHQAGAYGDEPTDADGSLETAVEADEPMADEADELSEEADAA